jgi:hypothetical protein
MLVLSQRIAEIFWSPLVSRAVLWQAFRSKLKSYNGRMYPHPGKFLLSWPTYRKNEKFSLILKMNDEPVLLDMSSTNNRSGWKEFNQVSVHSKYGNHEIVEQILSTSVLIEFKNNFQLC